MFIIYFVAAIFPPFVGGEIKPLTFCQPTTRVVFYFIPRGYNGISILRVLTRHPAIFSHIGHTAMAAEAPDLHQGDLGHLEEVRIALNGADIMSHK